MTEPADVAVSFPSDDESTGIVALSWQMAEERMSDLDTSLALEVLGGGGVS